MARWFFQEKEREKKKKVQKSTKMIEKTRDHLMSSSHVI